MDFLKKINHSQLLQFALGISIFSIGYLITMFYFQMQDLKDFNHKIMLHNAASIATLKLENNLDRDSYFTQSIILKENVLSQNTNLDDNFIINFSNNSKFLNAADPAVKSKNREIITLIEQYKKFKIELLKDNNNQNTSNFNTNVNRLTEALHDYTKYIDSRINIYNKNYDRLLDDSKTSGFLIALISLVIFVLAFVKMNEDIEKLKRINDEILFMNQTLNNAEIVAGFGSWKINTVCNTFIISDNFYRLLGLQPREVEPSLDMIMEFIHPDDREEVMELHKKTLATKETTAITYRYLLKDGTIRHMVSVGKFLNNSKGQLVKIGVNQDITQLMKKSKELEEKNAKLIAMNSELESFNNIVGHDLQEPLRKIQMFISRIESKEFLETSSESTVGYFGKIKSAAERMQNLMTDLVNYTRTIKGDRIFEQVDLNEVFEEILEELSLTIEEKNAKISIDKLPTILGTRFQIQQLFVNLISNALKYVKGNIEPIISIKLENFTKEFVNEKTISASDYHKITVSDNGIGFEQKHADKIFMLFKRLETDQTYKGTGLGLAICKKIVDNNNGLITAVGVPDKGSVFTVYLPKNTHFE